MPGSEDQVQEINGNDFGDGEFLQPQLPVSKQAVLVPKIATESGEGEEQFISPEAFMSTNNATDWDALISRGSGSSQASVSKWERDSLYVKFDPLVAARNPMDRASFMFKAPKPPVPSGFLKPDIKRSVNEPPLLECEDDESFSTDLSMTEMMMNMKIDEDEDRPIESMPKRKSERNSEGDASQLSFETAKGMNDSEGDKSMDSFQSAHPISPDNDLTSPECDIVHSPLPMQAGSEPMQNSPIDNPQVKLQSSPPKNIAQVKPPINPLVNAQRIKRKSLFAERRAQIAQLKERIATLKHEVEGKEKELHEQSSANYAELEKAEESLSNVEEERRKLQEFTEKVKVETAETAEAVRVMEARFAEMLAMYEDSKKCHEHLERNCKVLKQRDLVLSAICKAQEGKQGEFDVTAKRALELMKHDFEEKVNQREAENTKLKAKNRMSEMKANKLEGEISQLDRENDKLQTLLNELINNGK